MSDLASGIYDETSNLGKSYATIQIIIGIIIFIALCICGIYFEFKPTTTGNVTAKVTTVDNCNKIVRSEQTSYECVLQVTYTVNGKVYTNSITLDNSQKYVLNQDVDISYELNNPNVISPKEMDNKLIGSSLILVGIVIMISCGVNYYLASNSKLYAASTGTATTIDIFKNAFK